MAGVDVIRDLFASSPAIVVAHRGLALEYPENTLPAFHAALEAGADMLETDVHLSADGVAVAVHDSDLLRIAGRSDAISSLTLPELRAIDLGGTRIPTLSEVLEEFPRAPISIDIKSEGAESVTAEAIRAARANSRVMIASFSERRRAHTAALLPGAASAGTTRHAVPAYLASLLGQPQWARSALDGIDALFLPPQAFGVRLDTHTFATGLASLGIVLGMWTINDGEVMRRMWSEGVRAIVTDRTDLAIEARAQL